MGEEILEMVLIDQMPKELESRVRGCCSRDARLSSNVMKRGTELFEVAPNFIDVSTSYAI